MTEDSTPAEIRDEMRTRIRQLEWNVANLEDLVMRLCTPASVQVVSRDWAKSAIEYARRPCP
jgi:hypothetical protein